MQNLTKVIAVLSLVGTMSVAGLARSDDYAAQFQARLQITQVRDGNGKQVKFVAINDTGKSTTMIRSSDSDDGQEKQETTKLQKLRKFTVKYVTKAAICNKLFIYKCDS